MKSKQISSLMLVLAAAIWGSSFVAQSLGMDYVGPYTFTAVRSFIAGFFLLGCSFISDRFKARKLSSTKGIAVSEKTDFKILLKGGVCCGIFLAIAGTVQQIGIMYTSVGKAGFITTLYIILIPIIGIFMKKKAGVFVWVSALIALIGLYMLCVSEGFSVGKGDIYILACAFFFALHIIVIGKFSPKTDSIKLSCVQFFTCGTILLVPMFLFETPDITSILSGWKSLLYTSVLSSGLAFTLQIIAQKNLKATVASLIMSLESVFSALAGWLILKQELSGKELIGCALVFAAIVLAQVTDNSEKKEVLQDEKVLQHTDT